LASPERLRPRPPASSSFPTAVLPDTAEPVLASRASLAVPDDLFASIDFLLQQTCSRKVKVGGKTVNVYIVYTHPRHEGHFQLYRSRDAAMWYDQGATHWVRDDSLMNSLPYPDFAYILEWPRV